MVVSTIVGLIQKTTYPTEEGFWRVY